MSETVKIRFTSYHPGFKSGDVVDMDEWYARLLVKQGRAALLPCEKMVEGKQDKMMRKCETK